MTMCGSKEGQFRSHLSPAASFSILIRNQQRELRARLKESLRVFGWEEPTQVSVLDKSPLRGKR